ncbi:MAG: antitoxin VbhA family protein [Halanaerobiales bacterium]|nr:antitoxin VbhA family protein [Halanaerobiales bacterium]
MKTEVMSKEERKRSIANVRATLAVEDLDINRFNIVCGIKYLKGQISSEEAIDNITKYIKSRMS